MTAVSTDITSAPIYRIITDLNDLLTHDYLNEAVSVFHGSYAEADAFTANCMFDWLESSSKNAVEAGEDGDDLLNAYRVMYSGSFGSAEDFDGWMELGEPAEETSSVITWLAGWQRAAVKQIAKEEGLKQGDVLALAILGHSFDTKRFRKGVRQTHSHGLATSLPTAVIEEMKEAATEKSMSASAFMRDLLFPGRG